MTDRFFLIATGVAAALAGCQSQVAAPPETGIFPRPVENYVCDNGARLAVRLLGEKAEVTADEGRVLTLPQIRSSGDEVAYSNGRQTLIIKQGQVSWALGKAAPIPCQHA